MHGGLAAHPRGVDGAVLVLDVLGDAEAQVLHVAGGARHIRGHLVEVVQADQGARGVEVVAPGQALDVLDVVEELVGEAQRILDAHGVADALDEAVLPALDAAAQLLVEGDRLVQVLGGAYAVGERGHGGGLALAQHQVVVDELLHGAQVDGLLVLLGDHQAEHVHVELAGGGEVRDHELHRGAAQDVRRLGRRGGEGVLRVDGGFLRDEEAGGGLLAALEVGHRCSLVGAARCGLGRGHGIDRIRSRRPAGRPSRNAG